MKNGHDERGESLTEFGVLIRLVYLWFATADRSLSPPEGVFPPQKQSSPRISRCALGTSGDTSISRIRLHRLGLSPTALSKSQLDARVCGRIISPIPFSGQPPAPHLGSRPRTVCVRVCVRVSECVCVTERCRNGNECAALCVLTPAQGQSIRAAFEYSHGSANRMKEKAAAASDARPVKVSTLLFRGTI